MNFHVFWGYSTYLVKFFHSVSFRKPIIQCSQYHLPLSLQNVCQLYDQYIFHPPSTPIPLKITSLTHAVVSTSIRCRMIAYNVVSMWKRRHVPPGEGLSQNHRFVTDGKSIRSSYIKIVIQHLVSKYWLDLLGTNRYFSY